MHARSVALAAAVLAASLAAQSPSSFLLVNNLPGTFTDISTTGTVLGSGDEGSWAFASAVTNALVPSPTLYANSNGYLTGSFFSGTGAAWQNSALPLAAQSLGLFAMWDDLMIDATASLRHQAVVENGINVEIVQWTQVRTFASGPAGARGTFEIKIFGGGPVLAQFLYRDANCAALASLATIGAQWSSSAAAQYSLNTPGSVTAGTVLSVIPPDGLFPGFTASPTRGASPLAVQFTDASWTSDPAGITGWAWDFDGDGIADSTVRNPSWTFGSGTFPVSLTVTDAVHAPATVTRAALVVTDIVTPNFSWQALGNDQVQFTDATTPAATSWAWDFDGDNVVDSTAQNPVWTFPHEVVSRTVRLTASRLSGAPASATKQVVVAAQGLATIFTGGLGSTASGTGNCFDLTVTNPAGISINGVAMCPRAATTVPLGAPISVDMYVTRAPGGYANNHWNAAVWRRVGTGTGFYRGGTVTAPVAINMTFGNSVYLPPGTYGLALHMNGCGLVTTAGNAGNTTYGNADLSLSMGDLKPAPFAANDTPQRVWNGVLFYDQGGQTDFTAPVADGGDDTTMLVSGDVHLDGSRSSDDRSAMRDLTYEWSLLSKPAASNASLTAVRFGPTGSWFHVDVWGEYRVRLVVIDEQGNRSQPDDTTFTLLQDITPPIADAGQDQAVHTGNQVVVDGTASSDDTTPSGALRFDWSFLSVPAGSVAQITRAYSNSSAYFWSDVNGEYRILLTVTDEQGNSSTDEVVVSTNNLPPTADAGLDQVGVVQMFAGILAGDASYDPDWDYLLYEWTVVSSPPGSTVVFAFGGSGSFDYFTPDVVGTYVIQLVVHDFWGGYSAPDTVTIVAVTPTDMALRQIREASELIRAMPASSFDARGHQKSMGEELREMAKEIQEHHLGEGRRRLEDLIERVDGFALRSAFDPKGAGQPFKADFIVEPNDQVAVFNLLTYALGLLLP